MKGYSSLEGSGSRGTTAPARREIGITQWANGLIAPAPGGVQSGTAHRPEGLYPLPGGEEQPLQGQVLPDGYVRRSPVQELVEEPGYRQQLLRRAMGWALGTVAVAVAVWALLQFGIIGI